MPTTAEVALVLELGSATRDDCASCKFNTQSPLRQITQDAFLSASDSAKDAQVFHNA
mgnify:CR=1 FL=1